MLVRQHTRRNFWMVRILWQRLWKEQANGLVPYLRAHPRCIGSIAQMYNKCKISGNRAAALSSRPVNGDGTSRAVLLISLGHLKVPTYQRRACYAML